MNFDTAGSRYAIRDYYEDCTFIEEPISGKEIGQCRVCGRSLWIGASTCARCGYDPRIEHARREAQLQKLLCERRQLNAYTSLGFVLGFTIFGAQVGMKWGIVGEDLLIFCVVSGGIVGAAIRGLLNWAQDVDNQRERRQ